MFGLFQDHHSVAFIQIGQDRTLDTALITDCSVLDRRCSQCIAPLIAQINVLSLFLIGIGNICIFRDEIQTQVEVRRSIIPKKDDLLIRAFRCGITGKCTVNDRIRGRVDRDLICLQRCGKQDLVQCIIPVETLVQGTAHKFIGDVQGSAAGNQCPVFYIVILKHDGSFIGSHLSEIFGIGHPLTGWSVFLDQPDADNKNQEDEKRCQDLSAGMTGSLAAAFFGAPGCRTAFAGAAGSWWRVCPGPVRIC